jgi:hypothetical protein
MSSNVFAAPLRLDVKPARRRRVWRWASHLAVFTTLPLLQSPWLMAVVLACLMLNLYRTRTASLLTLLWRSDDHWTLFENGKAASAQLEGVAFVQPWLVILPLRPVDSYRLRCIPLFPDELPEPAFRQLRVRLRMHREVVTEAGGVQY